MTAHLTLTIEEPYDQHDRAAYEMLEQVKVGVETGVASPIHKLWRQLLSISRSRYHDVAWLMKLRLWPDRSTLSAFVDAELPLVRDPWIRREALGVAAEHLAAPGYTDQARKYIALGREPGIYRSTDFGLLFAEGEVRRIEEALAAASTP